MNLLLSIVFQPLMLALCVGPDLVTESPWPEKRREGTVVLATADRLVMRLRTWEVQAGTTYHYRLAPGALVTSDGMLCNLEDLRQGQRVRVTALAAGEWSQATCVEALDEQSAFPVAIAMIVPSRTAGRQVFAAATRIRDSERANNHYADVFSLLPCVLHSRANTGASQRLSAKCNKY